jgi:hypothetical protein
MPSELKSHFPNLNIQFGGADEVTATISPTHQLWKPIIICKDRDEIGP